MLYEIFQLLYEIFQLVFFHKALLFFGLLLGNPFLVIFFATMTINPDNVKAQE